MEALITGESNISYNVVLLLFELIIPIFASGEVKATSSKRLYYNFEIESFSENPIETQYSASSIKVLIKILVQ